ncbi:MAG: DUF2325 domain-containing protein [Bacillota bacterium]
MKCLIVGTDRLGAAPQILHRQLGVSSIVHWTGREKKLPEVLPKGLEVIVVYSQFTNHQLMWAVKKLAKKQGIKTIYIRRGLSELSQIGTA